MLVEFLAWAISIIIVAAIQDKMAYERGKKETYQEIMKALGVRDGYHIVAVQTAPDR